MNCKYSLAKVILFYCIAGNITTCAETKYKSQDYLHLIDYLKSQNIDDNAPEFYKRVREEGLVVRPRLFELLRRIEMDRSGFGKLNSENLPLLLHSQIDENLVNGNHNINGLVSVRIIISHRSQITRMLCFDRTNTTSQEMRLTEWARQYSENIIDLQTSKDWKDPVKFDHIWNADDFMWLNSIFADPMPPVDYASEIQGNDIHAYVCEAIIVDDGVATYKWAIRSSHHTLGFRSTFLPTVVSFLENINMRINTNKAIDESR